MSGFRKDFEWQSRFLPAICSIVGPLLLEPAPLEIDKIEATDLVVLRAKNIRVGCRVRRAGYAEQYPFEFTIRSHRDSGAKTELKKIIEGWGDLLFYGHAERNDLTSLCRWYVVDLFGFRGQRDKVRSQSKANGDGTYFNSYDVRSFNPSILISSSHVIPTVVTQAASARQMILPL